jgi:NTE family protein
LDAEADDKVCNIVHLIFHARQDEGIVKDYEFFHLTMEEHWQTGYNDVVDTLSYPEVLQRPEPSEGVRTFDLTRRDGN